MTQNGNEHGDAPRISRDQLRAAQQKRFYETVATVEQGGAFAVTLDGRPVKTPARHSLALPTAALAEAVAAEWRAQATHIDAASMPLTRLVNAAIDGVVGRMDDVAAHIVSFAASDLLCYRAEAPAALVRRQGEAWDPVLEWAAKALGARMRTVSGMMPVEQPAAALGGVEKAVAAFDPFALAALHVLTTISGSALLALAHANDILTLDAAWAAATVDETWQSEQWGRDAEAEELAARRHADFAAASRCLRLLPPRR